MKKYKFINIASIIFGISFLVYLFYGVSLYSMLPQFVPMGYDGSGNPTWHASREVYFVWFFIVFALMNLILFISRKANPNILDGAIFLFNFSFLVIFHVLFQQITPQKFLYLSVNSGLLIVSIFLVPSVIWLLYKKLIKKS